MEGKKLKQVKFDLALLGVAFVWGSTFVVVQDALSGIGPYYFLAIRFLIAGAFLALVYRHRLSNLNTPTLITGCVIGLALFAGYALQTVGLQYTKASNAGFITGLSVVLVPLFDPALLAFIQISTVSAVSFAFGFFSETLPSHFTKPVWMALLITAIQATSLAFLIQNTVQKFTSPTHTVLIFTMEPVFAAFTAYILAGEKLTSQQWLGCLLIITGMVVAELKSALSPKPAAPKEISPGT